MWFIGVDVEQETSAPPPKKNPGSAPDPWSLILPYVLNYISYSLLIIMIMQKLGKICRHHQKERLNINKIAKFESNLLKTSTGTSLASEDTAP